MMDAVIAVRRAIQAHLLADEALLALLGGPRIHDEPPRAAAGPYIVHGDVEARDWSTGTEAGCEQRLSILVWAGRGGESAAALAIAARLAARLHDAQLEPAGHRLVQLRQTGLDLRRDGKTGLGTATVTLRCVTEQL